MHRLDIGLRPELSCQARVPLRLRWAVRGPHARSVRAAPQCGQLETSHDRCPDRRDSSWRAVCTALARGGRNRGGAGPGPRPCQWTRTGPGGGRPRASGARAPGRGPASGLGPAAAPMALRLPWQRCGASFKMGGRRFVLAPFRPTPNLTDTPKALATAAALPWSGSDRGTVTALLLLLLVTKQDRATLILPMGREPHDQSTARLLRSANRLHSMPASEQIRKALPNKSSRGNPRTAHWVSNGRLAAYVFACCESASRG
jgi:hypothetical protein